MVALSFAVLGRRRRRRIRCCLFVATDIPQGKNTVLRYVAGIQWKCTAVALCPFPLRLPFLPRTIFPGISKERKNLFFFKYHRLQGLACKTILGSNVAKSHRNSIHFRDLGILGHILWFWWMGNGSGVRCGSRKLGALMLISGS